MLDFWGILGNAVTDDTFRNGMFATFKNHKTSPSPYKDDKYACMFDDQDYAKARALVAPKMGAVSLMALGEWLAVSILYQGSESRLGGVAQVVQSKLGNYRSTDPIFFQALGASIVDPAFRAEFIAGNERQYGFNLTANDRLALAPVIADPAFVAAADQFQIRGWIKACKDMVIQPASNPYAHPLEYEYEQGKPAWAS